MITTDIELLVEWLAANPAPIHTAEVPDWSALVQSQLDHRLLAVSCVS